MPDEIPEPTLEQLQAKARRLALFVVMMTPSDRWAEAEPGARGAVLREHLLWQQRLERTGVLLLAGPLDADLTPGRGMAVVRAESREAAVALAETEPFARAGLRDNEVRAWTVNEGSITLTVRLFDDHGTLR